MVIQKKEPTQLREGSSWRDHSEGAKDHADSAASDFSGLQTDERSDSYEMI